MTLGDHGLHECALVLYTKPNRGAGRREGSFAMLTFLFVSPKTRKLRFPSA